MRFWEQEHVVASSLFQIECELSESANWRAIRASCERQKDSLLFLSHFVEHLEEPLYELVVLVKSASELALQVHVVEVEQLGPNNELFELFGFEEADDGLVGGGLEEAFLEELELLFAALEEGVLDEQFDVFLAVSLGDGDLTASWF